MTVTMTRAQYDALINAGLEGNTSAIESLRSTIDGANSITRYRLNIRWQDVGGSPPPTIELGKGWPPELTFLLELERPIAKEDVLVTVSAQANNPVDIHVTPDVTGAVGWTLIDDFDFTAAAG